jgi:uncharacterized damage-inducible protein DinB
MKLRILFKFAAMNNFQEALMTKKDFQILYDYNRWANACVLEAAAKLTAEQFTRDLANSFRSVRDTLVHIMSVEWIWLRRWKGTSPKSFHDPSDFPNVEALLANWAEIETEQMDFVNSMSDESLGKMVAYVNTKGETWTYPLWQMLQHLVNHSTYHRGQITTMLRQLGAEPATTDFLVYFDQKNRQ